MRKGFRKIMAVATAFMMSVSMMMSNGFVALAAEAPSNPPSNPPSGFTNDGAYMAYQELGKNNDGSSGFYRYDLMGYSNNWTQIMYKDKNGQVKGIMPGRYGGENFSIKIKDGFPIFVDKGRAIVLDYVVTNNSDKTDTTMFTVAGDTAVNGNDASINKVNNDILQMTSGNYTFFVYGTPNSGIKLIPTSAGLINGYGSANSLAFDPSTIPYKDGTEIEDSKRVDSAFVAYWPKTSFAPKSSKEFVLIASLVGSDEICSSEELQDIVKVNEKIDAYTQAEEASAITDYNKYYSGEKKVNCYIKNTSGSTVKVKLPDLPNGAKYTTVNNSNGDKIGVSSISENGEITITSKADLGTTPLDFTVVVDTSKANPFYYPYDVTVVVNPKDHIHNYKIRNGGTEFTGPKYYEIVAENCRGGSGCKPSEVRYVIKSSDEKYIYDYGENFEIIRTYTSSKFSEESNVDITEIEYFEMNGDEVGNKVNGVPSEPGKYRAQFTVTNTIDTAQTATAYMEFTINLANIDTSSLKELLGFTDSEKVTYNGNPQGITLTPESGLGTVTVKYYDEDGNLIKDESDNPIEPTEPGTYKVKVEIAEGTGYNALANETELGEFIIEKATYPVDGNKKTGTILNEKDSVVEITLPTLPEGGAYGTLSNIPSNMDVSIVDNKLVVKAKENLSTGDINIKVPVTGAKYYNDYELDVTVAAIAHEHDYEYSESGNKIKAECKSQAGTCSAQEVALEIKKVANDIIYDGNTFNGISVDSTEFLNETSLTIENISEVKYYKKGESVPLTEAPKDAGEYEARVTVTVPGEDGADPKTYTAVQAFKIEKQSIADADAAKELLSYTNPGGTTKKVTYDENDTTGKKETVDAKDNIEGLGEITVKYYKKDASPADTTGSTTPPTDAGTYIVKASIAEGDNYGPIGEFELDEFTIEKASHAAVSLGAKEIVNTAGSVLEIDLGTLPAGAKYGSIQVSGTNVNANDIEAKIEGNKLIVTTKNNISLSDKQKLTVSVQVKDATNYNDYNETIDLTPTAHKHKLNYSAAGDVITASCTGDGACTLENDKATLTLNAPASTTYSGTDKEISLVGDDFNEVSNATQEITYYKKGDSTPLTEKPKDAGDYTAKVKVTDPDDSTNTATATLDFSIDKKTLSSEDDVKSVLSVASPGGVNHIVVYDGQPKAENISVMSGTEGLGNTITVKYYKKDGDTVATEGTTTPPTDAGTYVAKLSISEGTNYNAVENVVIDEFTISKASHEDDKSLGDTNIVKTAGSQVEITLPALPAGASYGAAVVPAGANVTAGNVASTGETNKITITSTGITGDEEIVVKVPVVNATNYETYYVEVKLNPEDHDHAWKYSKSGDDIIATCEGAGECDEDPANVKITVAVPDDNTYSGSPIEIKTTDVGLKAATGVTDENITTEYYKGTTKLDGAPTDVGTYKAVVTVTDPKDSSKKVSVEKEFTIAPKTLTADEAKALLDYNKSENMIYDGEGKSATTTPKSGVTGLGVVTLKYYDSEGKLVTDPDDSTKPGIPIDAGTYTVKASIAAGDNYGAINDVVIDDAFFIGKATGGVSTSVNADITTTKNGTTTITLPAIPDGASYGTPSYSGTAITVPSTVTDGKVIITTNNVSENDTLTVTIPVKGGNNHEDYNITLNLKGVDHVHNYDTFKEENGKIVATCSGDGNCPEETVALTLTTTNPEYSGTPYAGATVNSDFATKTGATVEIKYVDKDGNTVTAPTDAGTYKAQAIVTYGEEPNKKTITLEKEFTISPKKLADKANEQSTKDLLSFTPPSPAKYDGNPKEVQVDAAEGVKGLGDVTIKYYDKDNNLVKDPTDPTKPGVPTTPGTYKVYADIAAGDNYGAVTDVYLGEYTIDKGDYAGTKTVSGNLARPEGSKLVTNLPTLPAGASYGTPNTNGDSSITATIGADGKITVVSNGIAAEGTKTIKIPVSGGANYNDYEITVTVNVSNHVHAYEYKVNDNGNIVAECKGQGGSCDKTPVELAINPLNPTYSGEKQDVISLSDNFTEDTGSTVKVEYLDSKGNVLKDVPTEAGTYTARVTVTYGTEPNTKNIVTEKTFTIQKKDLDPKAEETKKLLDYEPPYPTIYDGNNKKATVTPAEGANIGNITVRYYDENGKEVKSTFRPGTYTVKADIAAGGNYNAVKGVELGSFTITEGEYIGTNEVSVDLPRTKNSSVEILLPAIPAGTSYGVPDKSNTKLNIGNVFTEGNNNKLLVASNGIDAEETIKFKVPVNGNGIFDDFEMEVIVNVIDHEHDYKYSVDGNVVTGTCVANGSCSKKTKTLKLETTSGTYSGEEYQGAKINKDEFVNATGANVGEIVYYEAATGFLVDGIPTDAGTYVAKVKVSDPKDPGNSVIAEKQFTIEPKELDIAGGSADNEPSEIVGDVIDFVPPTNAVYDGQKKDAVVKPADGITGLGSITVKYYDEKGNQVTGVPSKPGKYVVKADIAPGKNYEGANNVTIGEFTIDKATYSGDKNLTCEVEDKKADGSVVTLPKLPAGASFGKPEAPAGYEVSITPDGKVIVKNQGAAPGSKAVVKIPVKGGENYKDYTIEIAVTVTDHVHVLGEKHNAVPGTCTKKGTIEWYECTSCDSKLDANKKPLASIEGTVDANKHNPADAVKENVVNATTTVPSSYDSVVYCKDCKKELSREKITGSVLPNTNTNVSVTYRTHIQRDGWQSYVKDGKISGTTAQSKRMESVQIKVVGDKDLGITYSTHCQTYGWLNFVKDDAKSGTEGQSKRLEAIKIKLTGANANKYDVYYRVHSETYGWLGWAKNGEPAGTECMSKRMEAIQIILVEKGKSFDKNLGGITSKYPNAFYKGKPNTTQSNVTSVAYKTHLQTFGWQPWKRNGEVSGTTLNSKRLEAININIENPKYSGGIMYKMHLRNIGWEPNWKRDGQLSGTTGQQRRSEAIQIKLYGEMAEKYDVYYRVHVQTFGWLGWTKNGASAGTSGYGKRLEAIQIVLVEKGGAAPSANYGGVIQHRAQPYIYK